jgi:ABC-type multidrug transport system fused ATPase/permease subunit
LLPGDVSFDRVSFSYELGVPILKDVTFHVPGGRTIAFVVGG